jgi:RNA polymerase sigma factor (sigma-70 family)
LDAEDLTHNLIKELLDPVTKRKVHLIDAIIGSAFPAGYVRRAVLNAAIDEARRRAKVLALDGLAASVTEAPNAHFASHWNALESIIAAEEMDALIAALDQLPKSQRDAILMRLAGRRVNDIAKAQSRSYDAVATDMSRSMDKLRSLLGKTGMSQVEERQEVARRLSVWARNSKKIM